MVQLGGYRVLGDSSFWVFVQKKAKPRNEADEYETIGFMGGHVDDFNRAGDLENEAWLEIRSKIDKAYKWGMVKTQEYRHTGIDLQVMEKNGERWVQMSQDFYVEEIGDLAISKERLRLDSETTLTMGEIAACRASLGALQWVATQTQLMASSRVNLLLTELTVNKNMQVAKEVQELVREVRSRPTTLRLWQIPEIKHWQDTCVVTLADQAHNNRPQGGSTGGLITFLGGPSHLRGEAGRLNVVGWKTWKLKRKCISTNDGEIQCMLEGEDSNFKTRLLWSQLNGCCAMTGRNHLEKANMVLKYVPGILGTDSRGGFDAVQCHEGPMLGLANARSALQAYQLREQLKESGRLIWLSGDWNLSDAMTKKPKASREGLEQFLRQNVWMLRFDPEFIRSEKKSRKIGQSAVSQMRQLQAVIPFDL